MLRQGLTPVLGGLLVGLAGALAAGKLLTSLLFGVPASDPAILAGVAVLLVMIGVLACALPALRALRTDPVSVLRQ